MSMVNIKTPRWLERMQGLRDVWDSSLLGRGERDEHGGDGAREGSNGRSQRPAHFKAAANDHEASDDGAGLTAGESADREQLVERLTLNLDKARALALVLGDAAQVNQADAIRYFYSLAIAEFIEGAQEAVASLQREGVL